MSEFGWGEGLAGLGSLASIGGGFLGGQSQNRAARQAMDTYGARTSEGMNRLGMAFFGPNRFMDLLGGTDVAYGGKFRPEALEGALSKGVRPEGISEDQWGELQGLYRQWQGMRQFTNEMGGPLIDQLRGLGSDASKQFGGAIGRYDAESGRLSALGQSMLGQRDRLAEGVTDTARGNIGIARGYGQGREAQIRRDAGKYRNDLNDQTSALMASRGFGGTLEANQMAANARGTQEMQDDAITRLQEGVTDRRMAAQGALANTQAGLLGGRDAIQQAMLGNEYGRSGQRSAYDMANVDRMGQYKMLPIQSAMGVLQGSVMNPHLGQNTSQYFPGVSPMGNALQAGGNAAAGLGSAMLGQEWMKKLLGSGGGAPSYSSAYGPFQN